MRNYIILNNKNSNTISGLIIQELAPISKPLQRTQIETIDGRDGDIVTPLGYAAYNKKIKIGLYGNFNINDIIAYFATKGTAIFSNEPDKYYYYQIVDQIDYDRLVRYRVATVTMHVQPFKYSATEGTITVDTSDTVSDEGSDIALDGTAEAPFNVLRHKGNATQKAVSGKNLWGGFDYTVVSYATAKYNKDGTLTITGTSSSLFWTLSTSAAYQNNLMLELPAGTYAFYVDGSTYDTQLVSTKTDGTGENALVTINGGVGSGTFITTETRLVYPRCRVSEGATNKTVRFMIVKGVASQIGDYEPYTGSTPSQIVPSPNPDYPQDIQVVTGDSTVKITNKNLLNLHDGYMNAQPSRMDAEIGTNSLTLTAINTTGAQYATWQNNFDPTKTYILSGKGKKLVTGTDGRSFLQVRWRGSNDGGTTWSNYVNVYTNETPSINTEYAYNGILTGYALYQILFYNNSYTPVSIGEKTTYYDLQIEQSDQATDYEEFKSQSYVLPFGDTYLAKIGDYADEPVNVDGTWYIRRAIGKVVLDGTEPWSLNSNERVFWFTQADAALIPAADISPILSDYYIASAFGYLYNASVDYGISCHNSSHWLAIRNKDISTVANFKAWLAAHNTTVYYPLATPTDEAITDQDLIDALDELYDQAHAYKGHTHITATAADGNAPAVLSVEVGEDNESTVTNAGNTTSRPILTIYGQGDIGVYINDVEVLDVALGDEEYITLDSVEMEAYKDTTANLKNRLVTGDYSKLALNAGANKIRFTGTVTKYEISKYSRWL